MVLLMSGCVNVYYGETPEEKPEENEVRGDTAVERIVDNAIDYHTYKIERQIRRALER